MFNLIIFIIAAGFLRLATPQCPTNIQTKDFGGRCFEFVVNDKQTWQGARSACRAKGGDLATVETDYIYANFLQTELDNAYQAAGLTTVEKDSGVWIGGEDFSNLLPGSPWKWVIQHGTKTVDFTWSNWAQGQPGGGLLWLAENCVAMRRDLNWQWHDYACDSLGILNFLIGGAPIQFNYVCEWQKNETLILVQNNAIGNICEGTSTTITCEYDHQGPFSLYTYALIKYDSNGQNAVTVYNNTNNVPIEGSSWTGRVSGSVSGPSNNRYTANFQMSGLSATDAGKYACEIQYVEFQNPWQGGASLIQADATKAQLLSIMIAPSTQFVFTICRKADPPQCQSTGAQNFRKVSLRTFTISSTSDQFNAICTIPTNPGTPAGSLELSINGKTLTPNAAFPDYLYAQQTVQQLLDANTAANTNNLYLSCALITEANQCLSNQADATKTIQISAGQATKASWVVLTFSALMAYVTYF